MKISLDKFDKLQYMLTNSPNKRCYGCPFTNTYTDEHRKHMQSKKWTWHCWLFYGWFDKRDCNDVTILKLILENI